MELYALIDLDTDSRELIKSVASESILRGFDLGHPPRLDIDYYPGYLKAKYATFVTLHKRGKLRGCIGHLEATQPLIFDVNENAFNAASKDYRFDPVTPDELSDITISVSILNKPEAVDFNSYKDLLKKLTPNEDGVIVTKGRNRATFLPQVWEHLNDPEDFVTALLSKAGLSSFDKGIGVWKYSVLEVE